jgi:phenylalanyl-tRNA synthetase alpha chain
MSITQELEQQRDSGLAQIAEAADLAALDVVRVAYLGKKGSLTGVLRGLGSLPPEERPLAGKVSNDVRLALEAALEARHAELAAAAMEARIGAEAIDVTLPGRARPVGSRHLIEQIRAEVCEVFLGLG